MQQTDLRFKFKGNRQYIQGPDLLDETLTWLTQSGREPTDIDIAFHRMAGRQLAAFEGAAPAGVEPCAVCAFTSGGARQRVYLAEREEEVSERAPYPEEEILRTLRVDVERRSATLEGPTAYSDMEVFVSMTKALHQQALPELRGKWLFVRARLPRYVRHSAARQRSIAIVSTLGGKLTRSQAALDGVAVGEIFFSLV